MIGWFRSYHGGPSHRKWGLIAKRAAVPRSLVVALAWDLLDRASQASDRGSVAGYDVDSFAFDMDCEPADVTRILEAMRGADFLAGDRVRWEWDVLYDRPSGPAWAALRSFVFARDDFRCSYCGVRGGVLECDHILPVSRGGSHDPSNLTTACFACNRSKGTISLSEWRRS